LKRSILKSAGLSFLAIVYQLTASAAVLPEDRADALYHSYDGGDVEVTGPSILVRKSIGQSFSMSGNYYTDSVTSASIDVIATGASEYSEDRTQYSISGDYLHGNVIMSASYTNSDENDYEGNTASFSISQDLFGDLTNVSIGYAVGWDTVMDNTRPEFSEDVDRQTFHVGLSQIVTKDFILGANLEVITDEGFLNNPYRSVRYQDTSGRGYSYQKEIYPRTRTSTAFSLNGKYYLPYRAVLGSSYRFFSDDWNITAHTIEVNYVHPWHDWIFEAKYRYYTQTQADFYSDLFPFISSQNFMARDKELSDYTTSSIGIGASYLFAENGFGFIEKGTLNAAVDFIQFDYNNFRDARASGVIAGTEPLYSFDATVIRLFVSIWY